MPVPALKIQKALWSLYSGMQQLPGKRAINELQISSEVPGTALIEETEVQQVSRTGPSCDLAPEQF
jgi:hypothetical protein